MEKPELKPQPGGWKEEEIMENVILGDRDRLRSFATGYVSPPAFELKFLVVSGKLVIGPLLDHVALYAAYEVREMPLDEAAARFKTVSDEQWRSRNPRVTGAGVIEIDGRITSWKSGGFRIETPDHMRGEIERQVARLFQDGLLPL